MGNLKGKSGVLAAMFLVSALGHADEPADATALEARRRFEAGMSAIRAGDYQGGIAQLVALNSENPHPNTFHNIQVARACWVQHSRGDRGPDCFEAAPITPAPASLVADSNTAREHFIAGTQALQAGDYERAIRELDRANRIFPHYAAARTAFSARRCWVRLSEEPRPATFEDCPAVTGGRFAKEAIIRDYNEAKRLADEGQRLGDAGDCANALRRLERAYSLVPHEDVLMNVLRARRQCGIDDNSVPSAVPAPGARPEHPVRATGGVERAMTSGRVATRERSQVSSRVNPNSPSVSCDLVEIGRRENGEGRFETGQARTMGFGNQQGPVWESSPGVDLASGLTIDVLHREPKEGSSEPWMSSVRFRQNRGRTTPVRIIPVAPDESGNCPTRPLSTRLAVGRSAEHLLSDPSNRPLEFSDAALQPGQRSPVQRRCFAVNDPAPRTTQRYYELRCTQTRRRSLRPTMPGSMNIETGEPMFGGAGAAGQ